ncbi:DUF4465 domain-containing protein [Edaphocola aurantiacus]|uniref:DUF4465 domain-containing protein n=1 Tax=Edaphocola aurantiacus TaxID=2601682 RepID=UPI001C97C5D6|nr:DUF4465 domain-containing protein [Edaphocola aurantiacus]
MVKRLLLASAIMLSAQAQAQTVATFENLSLPNSDTLYVDFATNGYTVSSGLVGLKGSMMDYQGYTLTDGFSYSNIFDTTQCNNCYDLHYMYAGREGRGYNGSDKYAVAYAYSPAIATLSGAAAGHPVAGFMLSNTSWGYAYANATYAAANGWAKLTVKGFNNNVQSTDSVEFYLADYRSVTPAAQRGTLDSWKWLNLQSLGNVDSLTFRVTSSDDFFPSYFVMDNFVTMETGAVCADTFPVTVSNISANAATVNWIYSGDTTYAGNDSFEVVINQSATVGTSDVVHTVANQLTYAAASLTANTAYYAHVRAYCPYEESFSAWKSVPFTTQPNSIKNINTLSVQLYPNPTSGMLYFEYSSPLNVWVMDVNGQIVLRQTAVNAIDTRNLAAGQYFIRLNAENGKNAIIPFAKK